MTLSKKRQGGRCCPLKRSYPLSEVLALVLAIPFPVQLYFRIAQLRTLQAMALALGSLLTIWETQMEFHVPSFGLFIFNFFGHLEIVPVDRKYLYLSAFQII